MCAPDDHFGLLLHPLFPHAHGDAHASGPLADTVTGIADLVVAAQVDQAPGISAAASNNAAHDAIAGLLLPLLLAALMLEAARRIALTDLRPEQRALAPPLPPPRLAPSAPSYGRAPHPGRFSGTVPAASSFCPASTGSARTPLRDALGSVSGHSGPICAVSRSSGTSF